MTYTLDDFAYDLRKSTASPNHIWVNSGSGTVAPKQRTVCGVKGYYSPPFTAGDLEFNLSFVVNGYEVQDIGNLGKGDCGLLLSRNVWRPDKIVREGTYHFYRDGRLVSLDVTSELIPMFAKAGFLIKVNVFNRSGEEVVIEAKPMVTPGRPNAVKLDDWDFGWPPAGIEAELLRQGIWENGAVRVTLLADMPVNREIAHGTESTFWFACVLSPAGVDAELPDSLDIWAEASQLAWQRRLEQTLRPIPRLSSTIPGLEEYYKRSIVSGLICLWEHPDFAMSPLPVVCGMEGAGICTYPWDAGGYSGQILVLLLGPSKSIELARLMVQSGIERHSRFAPSGLGLNVPYSYNVWSFFQLVWCNIVQYGQGIELFPVLENLLKAEEERFENSGSLLDYGEQHNLLEMRGSGYEHLVSSPNAERAWCYDLLADLAESLGKQGASEWRLMAERIRAGIREQLWDGEKGWFKCIYPDGHVEHIYSIQAYNTLRMGVCTPAMVEALLSHLREGAFLGEYGVNSVSAEDRLHYELNDPDWSGGGSYIGSGPVLAQTLWEIGESGHAWNVLKRNLWMGKHFPYFPQEQYCDRPVAPAHKRANIISGVTGAQALIYGMAGIQPRMDGSLWVHPSPPEEGDVKLSGYFFRGHLIDVEMKPGYCEISLEGKAVYKGVPRSIKVV